MTPSPLSRWYPGVLAMRWRHVFWLAPVMGVLIALGIHLAFFHRTEIRTVIQIRAQYQSHVDPIHSNAIIIPVVRELNLAQRWQLPESTAVERVRKNLRQTEIRGTDLMCISYHEFDPTVAVGIPHAVVRQLGIQVDRWQMEKLSANAKRTEAGWSCSTFPPSSDLLHEDASIAQAYPSLRQKLTYGLCSGVLLTAPLAYLLEWLFPRRRTMNK